MTIAHYRQYSPGKPGTRQLHQITWFALLFSWVITLLFCSNTLAAGPTTSKLKNHNYEFPSDLQWLNVKRPLSLKELKGKVVILDFWTYGCINCIHVLEDLKILHEKYPKHLVIIGVHSPKFDQERNLEALRNIIIRYGIEHPVVNDRDFGTARHFAMRAWPTQVVIDPEGNVVTSVVGEGNLALLDKTIADLLKKHRSSLNASPLPVSLEKEAIRKSLLAAPGKISASDKHLAISDTLHHRIIITDHRGRIESIYGGLEAGASDGTAQEARFNSPQGLAFSDNGLYVADTGNHRIRHIRLDTGHVTTIAGGGELRMPRFGQFHAIQHRLRSPWGLSLSNNHLYIAMAGSHQIWRLDLVRGVMEHYAGNGREGIKDGTPFTASFSQPSGLAMSEDLLYVADAESSSIRRINLNNRFTHTLVGKGLFDFGDSDGHFNTARLQHPLGLTTDGNKQILIADTYNHKIKVMDLETRRVRTIVGTQSEKEVGSVRPLNEPGGIVQVGNSALIADTNNNRIVKLDLTLGKYKDFELTKLR